MFSNYPSNVPEYNKYTIDVPQGALDETSQCYRVTAPAWLWRYMVGQMSQLSEVYVWEASPNDIRTAEDAVDAFNNGYSLDLCQDCVDMSVTIDRIGEVFAWPSINPPQGAIALVGQTINADQYPELFTQSWVTGVPTYVAPSGGNPAELTLPDMIGQYIKGDFPQQGLSTLWDTGGSDSVTLTEQQMPLHDHGMRLSPTDGGNNIIARMGSPTGLQFVQDVTFNAGSSLPHENNPPYTVWVWCMWVDVVILQNTYDYSVYSKNDCVLYQNNNGVETVILDVKQCAVDASTDRELVSEEDQATGQGDVDCMYGAAEKVVEYVLTELEAYLDIISAQADQVTEFIRKFPFAPVVIANGMFEAIAQITIAAIQFHIALSATRQMYKCDLFCELLKAGDFKVLTPFVIDNWLGNYEPGITFGADAPFYFAAKAIGYTTLARIYSLGWDECNNDWLQCDCIDRVVLTVDGDESSYQSSDAALIAGQRYKVSVSGVISRSGSGRDDGWFAWSSSDPNAYTRIVTGNTNQGVRLRFPDTSTLSVNELYVPIDRDLDGYLFEYIPDLNGVIQGRYQDTEYGDNGGAIVFQFVRTTS